MKRHSVRHWGATVFQRERLDSLVPWTGEVTLPALFDGLSCRCDKRAESGGHFVQDIEYNGKENEVR